MSNTYKAKDIQVLRGLEAVRMRPGMYIGSTEQRGLHHLLWEIVDNAIDEAANGFADTITVTLHKDHSATVEDNGRGIPVDKHPELEISGVEVVFTQLHAGGKFSAENYEYAGGLHGVGASVVNALSSHLEAELCINGILYSIAFESKPEPDGSIIPGKVVKPLTNEGRTRRKGSRIRFWPDETVFETVDFNFETISRRLHELSFLNKGVTLRLKDERAKSSEEADVSYRSDGGVIDFVKYLNDDKDVLFSTPIMLEGSVDDIKVSVAIQYNTGYSEGIYSYVNCIPTPEGGMHETGFKAAFTKCMNEYIKKNASPKDKIKPLTGEDYREGMAAVINLKMKNAQFEGQTKARLGNTEARIAMENIMMDKLSIYMEDLRNQKTVMEIISKATQSSKAREAARKAKSMARERNKLDSAPLVGKLASCTGRKASENELFIVEGDSAGGTAKMGRDRRFQAILPLRGKPLNSEKKRLEQVLANEEFRTIITALGTGIDEDFKIGSLKYDKIIILADADQDGAHIRAILLTFFYRYMKELVTQGHVYIGVPPLYKVTRGKKSDYAYDDATLQKLTAQKGNYNIQRYKGLGEMNPSQLWETTMDPKTRTLIRVDLDNAAEAERMVTVLMGDKPESRRQYIFHHADFDRTDAYERMEDDKSGVELGV